MPLFIPVPIVRRIIRWALNRSGIRRSSLGRRSFAGRRFDGWDAAREAINRKLAEEAYWRTYQREIERLVLPELARRSPRRIGTLRDSFFVVRKGNDFELHGAFWGAFQIPTSRQLFREIFIRYERKIRSAAQRAYNNIAGA